VTAAHGKRSNLGSGNDVAVVRSEPKQTLPHRIALLDTEYPEVVPETQEMLPKTLAQTKEHSPPPPVAG
jgi:hypothetical protein